jgi:streptogramin lyase
MGFWSRYEVEFPIPTASSDPRIIVAGPDGALWFVERSKGIGRIPTSATPANPQITEFAVGNPEGIALGPDGALWFTECAPNKIGRLVPGTAHTFDGGAKSDILWRDTGGTTAIWLMNGAQVSQSGGFGAVPTNWQIVGQRDFNGDGKHDLLWRDSTSGTVALWLMNGLQVGQTGSLGAVPTSWSTAWRRT